MRTQNPKALKQILRANSKIQILQMGSMPLNTRHAAIGTIAMAPKPPDELAGIEDRSQYRFALMQRLKAISDGLLCKLHRVLPPKPAETGQYLHTASASSNSSSYNSRNNLIHGRSPPRAFFTLHQTLP